MEVLIQHPDSNNQQQVWEGDILTPFSKNLPLCPQVHCLTIITSNNLTFSDLIKHWLASEIL